MIGCDYCNDWFHWECVGLSPPAEDQDDEEVAPADYKCPNCCSVAGMVYPFLSKVPPQHLPVIEQRAEAEKAKRRLALQQGANGMGPEGRPAKQPKRAGGGMGGGGGMGRGPRGQGIGGGYPQHGGYPPHYTPHYPAHLGPPQHHGGYYGDGDLYLDRRGPPGGPHPGVYPHPHQQPRGLSLQPPHHGGSYGLMAHELPLYGPEGLGLGGPMGPGGLQLPPGLLPGGAALFNTGYVIQAPAMGAPILMQDGGYHPGFGKGPVGKAGGPGLPPGSGPVQGIPAGGGLSLGTLGPGVLGLGAGGPGGGMGAQGLVGEDAMEAEMRRIEAEMRMRQVGRGTGGMPVGNGEHPGGLMLPPGGYIGGPGGAMMALPPHQMGPGAGGLPLAMSTGMLMHGGFGPLGVEQGYYGAPGQPTMVGATGLNGVGVGENGVQEMVEGTGPGAGVETDGGGKGGGGEATGQQQQQDQQGHVVGPSINGALPEEAAT